MAAGFLVPFLSGGLIKSQQIRDEYDENAGNIVDSASAKYNEQFDLNKKAIELQNSNYSECSWNNCCRVCSKIRAVRKS